MDLIDTLPPPEVIAQRIAAARRERDLLRRLYRLSRDARIAQRGTRCNEAGSRGKPIPADHAEAAR